MLLISVDGDVYSMFVNYVKGKAIEWSPRLDSVVWMTKESMKDYAAMKGWQHIEI